MNSIIQSLLIIVQYQQKQICWLLHFIAKYIPLKQWAFDDSHSPKYQKFKTDKLPKVFDPNPEWEWQSLIKYWQWRYDDKEIRPVKRQKPCDIPEDCTCPCCGAPVHYLYRNNGSKGQITCKVCKKLFTPEKYNNQTLNLLCPYCNHSLVPKKNRSFFIVHKCVNSNCSYYQYNLSKVGKEHLDESYGKNKYKLHYIYREFTVDFFKMDLDSLPENASSLKFRKNTSHIMGLCLTLNVNLGLSLRHSSQALKDLYGIKVSHTMIANYVKTAAVVIKPLTDHFDYSRSSEYVADETYVKVRGVKGYVWFIMDAISRSILGYQVSDNRSIGPCILAMRMAFRSLKELPKKFKFIADGYSVYPLAAQQFRLQENPLKFDITQVIGLTNDDEVSKEYRPYKQKVERLNRTFKASYRVNCGFDNYEGANYNVAIWVTYYNFLRPHKANSFKPLNHIPALDGADNMPGKWQILLHLGQKTILQLQSQQAKGST